MVYTLEDELYIEEECPSEFKCNNRCLKVRPVIKWAPSKVTTYLITMNEILTNAIPTLEQLKEVITAAIDVGDAAYLGDAPENENNTAAWETTAAAARRIGAPGAERKKNTITLNAVDLGKAAYKEALKQGKGEKAADAAYVAAVAASLGDKTTNAHNYKMLRKVRRCRLTPPSG